MSVTSELAGGRLTIDLGALVDNWKNLARHAGVSGQQAGAVVKANAYGCGIERVVPALSKVGCETFFVAVPEEGIRARAANSTAAIYVLNGLFAEAGPALQENNLQPVLGSPEEVRLWCSLAKAAGRALPCALQVDTGMHRMGLTKDEFTSIVTHADTMQHLDVALLMTHYACADDIGHPKSELQRERFRMMRELLPDVPVSAGNSAASLQGLELPMGGMRAGVAMYGAEALNNTPNPMKTVVTLEGRINRVRVVEAGESVGYGASETMTRRSRVAYVSVGYADGYHRAASNMGVPMRAVCQPVQAAFKGQLIKGVGRISMDLCGFDVTDIPENELQHGDWIELFGSTIPIDDVARAAGTIGYELLTGLGQRYARTYIGG